MSTPNPLEAESRATHAKSQEAHAKFYAELAKQSAPQPAAAPVQPNVEALAKAQQMQAEIDPKTGERRYLTDSVFREQVEATRRTAFETGPGSTVDRNQRETGAPYAAPPGQKWELNPDWKHGRNVWRTKLVPDSDYVAPRTAEPDEGARQTAQLVAQLGPERAAQNSKLNAFLAAVNPATGERYAVENPAFLANVEKARRELFDGADLTAVIAATEARLADSKYAASVKVEGYTVTAPEGFELEAGEIAKYAKVAKANGVSEAAFQAMVSEYVKENAQ